MDEPAPWLVPELKGGGAQARIVEKTFAGEYLQRAHILRPQQNVASPVAKYFVATRIFNDAPATADPLPERGGIESSEARAAVAGESDLVSMAQYFPQNMRESLRRPWSHEESCA